MKKQEFKEKVYKAMVSAGILLVFCTAASRVIEEKMTPVVDTVPVKQEGDEEGIGLISYIPAAAVYQDIEAYSPFSNDPQSAGIFLLSEETGLWGKELEAKFSVCTRLGKEEEWEILEAESGLVAGYSSKPLKDGTKVKRIER